MKRRLLLFLVVPLISCSGWVLPAVASAQDPLSGARQTCSEGVNAEESAICQPPASPTDNPLSGNNGLLLKITNLIALIGGISAVILIIIGGMRMVLAGGDSNDVASARKTVVYALVGVAVIVLAKVLITFVVSKI